MMVLSPHEQQQLQKNFKDNERFFQAYNGDLAMKRQLRGQALEVAVRASVGQSATGQQIPPNMDQVIEGAEKIFNFLVADGSLNDFATKASVELL